MANTYTLKAQSVASAPRSKRLAGQVASSASSRSSSSADLSGYLTRAEFARYFELVNVGTEAAPVTAIHALYDGLYSDGFVSALGVASAISEPAAGGLDLDQLEAYLTANRYATRDWVISQGYITADDIPDIPDTSGLMSTVDFNRWVNSYQPIDKQDLDGVLDSFRRTSDGRYVLKSGDTMTGTLTLPDLIANNSIRIGSATLTYDATTKAIRLSGAGFYSDSFISARGLADGVSEPSSAGLNETELADYLHRYGYITSSALATYATQAYVTSALGPYAKTVDVTAMLKDYAKLEELKKYVLKAGDTMTGTLTLPDLVANNSIRIGSATLTYDATTKAIHLSGAGFYSDSFISARGAASAISGEGVASINATLWGNRFTGTEDLTGPISVGQESSSASAYVGVSRNSQTLQLLVGSTGARGLWDPNKSNWLIAMNAGNFIQFSAGDYASFEMSVRCSSYIQGTRFTSTINDGVTAPLSVASSVRVANLNADMVDGKHASELGGGMTASEILQLIGNSHIEPESVQTHKIEGNPTINASTISCTTLYANSTVVEGDLSVDGDIMPMDPGGCYIGSEDYPWAEGHFTDLYVGGKKIDPNKLGGTSLTLGTATGSGNAITSLSLSNGVLTPTKGSTFLTSSSSLNASNLTSGTVPIGRIPTGTSSTTVALGNHTHTGYAAASHTHSDYAAKSHTHTDYLTASTAATAIFGNNVLVGKSPNNPYIGWDHPSGTNSNAKWYLQVTTNDGMWVGSSSKPIKIYSNGDVYIQGNLYVGGKKVTVS